MSVHLNRNVDQKFANPSDLEKMSLSWTTSVMVVVSVRLSARKMATLTALSPIIFPVEKSMRKFWGLGRTSQPVLRKLTHAKNTSKMLITALFALMTSKLTFNMLKYFIESLTCMFTLYLDFHNGLNGVIAHQSAVKVHE